MPRPPQNPSDHVIALIPAAGHGIRMGAARTTSKEVIDLGGRPLMSHLLERLSSTGVTRGVVVLREGKWDVPARLADWGAGVELAYVVVPPTPSELHSVAAGLSIVGDDVVAFGYPDILFEPDSAFSSLIERHYETGADVVLGLFKTDSPERVDMVRLDHWGNPVGIRIKQPDAGLEYSWCIAVWGSRFSRRIEHFLAAPDEQQRKEASAELSVGSVVSAALDAGVHIETVVFPKGHYVDVGTPEALAGARRSIEQGRD